METQEKPYDSRTDTLAHINRVRELMRQVTMGLIGRSRDHDASKLIEPEKSIFDRVTPKLRGLTYGSEEYKASLAEMGPALVHHYANNCHHPEYYAQYKCTKCGLVYERAIPESCHYCSGTEFNNIGDISRMDLLDLIEMLADWKAAGERHADGSMLRSLRVNQNRFAIDEQLYGILYNTAERLGWLQTGSEASKPASEAPAHGNQPS